MIDSSEGTAKVVNKVSEKQKQNPDTLANQRKAHTLEWDKKYALLTFSTLVFIIVVTGTMFILILYFIITEKNAIAIALHPYLTYPLSAIIGTAIGFLFARGRS